ncbi:MAG: glucosamine-6-phosphate deaminase, partial [Candidatus Limnocylindria bacterium]
ALVLAATGDTPMGCYAELAGLRRAGELDASRLRVAQLDEYLGLPDGDPRLLYGWMDRSLFAPLEIGPERVVRFPSDNDDPALACRAYDAQIEAAGGVDLAILGLGPNGHLGFNEPPSGPDAATRAISLTPESLESNARYWTDTVPQRALTTGMSVIMAARRVLLLVSGSRKASVLGRLIRSDRNPWLPASHLHAHPAALLLADRAALPDGPPRA